METSSVWACQCFCIVVSVAGMEISRRRLFVLGAASATVAGTSLLVAPGAHATSNGQPLGEQPSGEQPLGHGTTYDRQAKQQNPDNKLGCPLGKGL